MSEAKMRLTIRVAGVLDGYSCPTVRHQSDFRFLLGCKKGVVTEQHWTRCVATRLTIHDSND